MTSSVVFSVMRRSEFSLGSTVAAKKQVAPSLALSRRLGGIRVSDG
jgi:hypothetical protein